MKEKLNNEGQNRRTAKWLPLTGMILLLWKRLTFLSTKLWNYPCSSRHHLLPTPQGHCKVQRQPACLLSHRQLIRFEQREELRPVGAEQGDGSTAADHSHCAGAVLGHSMPLRFCRMHKHHPVALLWGAVLGVWGTSEVCQASGQRRAGGLKGMGGASGKNRRNFLTDQN